MCVCARAHATLTSGATCRPESNLQKSILSCQPRASQGIEFNPSGLAASVFTCRATSQVHGKVVYETPRHLFLPWFCDNLPGRGECTRRWLNEELMTDLVTELQGGLQLSFHKAWIPAQGYSPSTVSFMRIFSSERSLGSIT